MDIENTETDVYVIFVAGKGFVTGRSTMRFTDKFEKARVYNRECDADNSVRQWGGIPAKENAYVIPVRLTLDPKKIFKAVLRGK